VANGAWAVPLPYFFGASFSAVSSPYAALAAASRAHTFLVDQVLEDDPRQLNRKVSLTLKYLTSFDDMNFATISAWVFLNEKPKPSCE
jgi:hypothetical protein